MFLISRALFGRGPVKLRAAHSLAWLHLLDTEDLQALTLAAYAGKEDVSFASEEHNLAQLFPWEAEAFERHLTGCPRVLVAAAGGGREMIALARLGHEVAGFDGAVDLVDAARRNLAKAGVAGALRLAAPGQVPQFEPPFDGPFDGLVLGRGFYHHLPTRALRISFLSACRAALKPRAKFYLGDFMRREGRSGSHRLALRRGIEIGDHIGECFFHSFTREEIDAELGGAGFEAIAWHDTPLPPGMGEMAHVTARAGEGASLAA